MHAGDWREDRYRMVSELNGGGYSDDMTLGALAGQHGRTVYVPGCAVFLHQLPADATWTRSVLRRCRSIPGYELKHLFT